MTGGPVKVLIVDDAPIVRNVLTRELSRDSRIEVVGAAEDAYQARDMIIGTTDHTDLNNTVDHLETSITRTAKTPATGTGDREATQDKSKYRSI